MGSHFGVLAVLIVTTVFTVASAALAQQKVFAQGTDGQTQSFNALLAAADATAGEKISHKCAMCHTFKKGESDRIGPNLWNIVGNARAHSTSFNYSDALKAMHSEKWTYDALNLYIANPHKFVPGGKMPFAGIPDQKERADLIAWLRTLSDNPTQLPVVK